MNFCQASPPKNNKRTHIQPFSHDGRILKIGASYFGVPQRCVRRFYYVAKVLCCKKKPLDTKVSNPRTSVDKDGTLKFVNYKVGVLKNLSQHDRVRTTMKKRYTQNSFKIQFQDAHGQSGWALELDLPQGPIKQKNNLSFFSQ